jgi:outer membrane protein OmpA-like peptidoglycan-associated protein
LHTVKGCQRSANVKGEEVKKLEFSRRRPIAIAVAAALSLLGCAVDQKTGAQSFAGVTVSDDPCARTATVVGALLGGVAGAVMANQIDHRTSTRAAGIAAGATIGGLIGRDIDKRRCELYKIAKRHNVQITFAEVAVPRGQLPPPGEVQAPPVSSGTQPQVDQQRGQRTEVSGLSVTVRDSERQFESGADQLTPSARAYFGEVADQYSYVKQTQRLAVNPSKQDKDAVELLRSKRILLIGHTDDTGSSRGNADLSERRAMAVATVFLNQGIPISQLFYQGAGESLPIADNRTDEGRSINRRVEIVDVTDNSSFYKFLATRKQRIEYYRPTSPTVVAAPAKQTAHVPAGKSQTPPSPADKTTVEARGSSVVSASPPALSTSVASSSGLIDFGGSPASTLTSVADFGKEIAPKPGFSLISSAQAAGGPVVPSCSVDRPRVSNGVKSLRDQKDISITEYMPGLYNTSWIDTVNGHLVGLSNVAVYRDGGSPANKPNLYIFKGYSQGSGAKPDFTARPEVNAYRGDKAILYRVFVDGPVKCMDLLFPYDNSGEAKNSSLFYDKQNNLYVVAFKPRRAR